MEDIIHTHEQRLQTESNEKRHHFGQTLETEERFETQGPLNFNKEEDEEEKKVNDLVVNRQGTDQTEGPALTKLLTTEDDQHFHNGSNEMSHLDNKEYFKLIRCEKVKGTIAITCALMFRMRRVLITDLKGKILDSVDYSDLYGVSYLAGPPLKKATASQKIKGSVYYLDIHLYKKVSKKGLAGLSDSQRSLFQDIQLVFDNESEAAAIRNLFLHISHDRDFWKKYPHIHLSSLKPFSKKLLVIVNPNSGSGKAGKIWERVQPILERAGYAIQVLKTTHAYHAMEYCQNAPLYEILSLSGVVTVSGDGIAHEVLNGFYRRPDYNKVKHIPLGFIPGGSGNAIYKNIAVDSNERDAPENAAFVIAKDMTKQIDMTLLQTESGKRILMMLSLSWAFMSDCDLESESLRFLGGLRFEVYTMKLIAQLRRYSMTLSYTDQPITEQEMVGFDSELIGPKWTNVKSDSVFFMLANMAWMGSNLHFSPPSKVNDGYNDLVNLGGTNIGRLGLTKLLLKMESGKHFRNGTLVPKPGLSHNRVKAFRLDPVGTRKGIFSIDGEVNSISAAG